MLVSLLLPSKIFSVLFEIAHVVVSLCCHISSRGWESMLTALDIESGKAWVVMPPVGTVSNISGGCMLRGATCMANPRR